MPVIFLLFFWKLIFQLIVSSCLHPILLFIHHCIHSYTNLHPHSAFVPSLFPTKSYLCALRANYCLHLTGGRIAMTEMLPQIKWVCLTMITSEEVVNMSSACDMSTGWSCQTKPVKHKTNLPIHLSESRRDKQRWYNCAQRYKDWNTVLFLAVMEARFHSPFLQCCANL